jgi:hypothetical protein
MRKRLMLLNSIRTFFLISPVVMIFISYFPRRCLARQPRWCCPLRELCTAPSRCVAGPPHFSPRSVEYSRNKCILSPQHQYPATCPPYFSPYHMSLRKVWDGSLGTTLGLECHSPKIYLVFNDLSKSLLSPSYF